MWEFTVDSLLVGNTDGQSSKLQDTALTISVLQADCAVITEYAIPSDFVRKSTVSLQIKISTPQLNFLNRNVTIFWKYNNQQRQWGTDWIITTVFIQHLFRSSYFIVSVFRNSVKYSITDITKRSKILRLSDAISTWSSEWLFEAYRHCSDRQHFSMICLSNYQINGLKHNAANNQCSEYRLPL